ncbi:MAG: tetratricopeptide repeat protein [Acidobacteriota bacterium]
MVELLGRALELDPTARQIYLDQECADDPALRQELDSYLEEEESALDEGFLESPVVADLDDSTTLFLTEAEATTLVAVPKQLGPYRVVRRLGTGGMGTVYLGEQEEPVRRRVALKVIDGIHDSHRTKRFAAECQALARLSHPNVAALHEVGTTESGHPFVAMELIEGASITNWCDDRGLGLQQRIELFFDVCAGVRHAHEKGILHRDLKPSNVLVTEVDGKATAKVIDFGIARAVEEPLVAGPQMTLAHQLIGSPAYMSPEAAARNQDLDTRSDVYSLGLLLYKLLVGVLPYNTESESVEQILLRVIQGDQVPPSVRFAGLEFEHQCEIAAQRTIEVERLKRRIKGDLDAIVGKAIQRDREQRYSSPADLSADLRRYLRKAPVTARPRTATYLLSRFVARQPGLVASILALVVALVVGFAARTREAERANQEAVRASQQAARAHQEALRAKQAVAAAEEVSRFLIDLFEIVDPERRPDEPFNVQQLLERGVERSRGELAEQPLARARLLHTISEIYTKLALLDLAEDTLSEALRVRRAALPAEHPDVLQSLNQLGILYRRQGRFDEAESLLRQVLAARESADVPDPIAIALTLNNLANLLWSQRDYPEAEAVHRRVLALRERELGSDHADVAASLSNLSAALVRRFRYQEAKPLLERAVDIFVAQLGEDHPHTASALYNLASTEEWTGEWQQAEAHFRQAWQSRRAAYGDEHPDTLRAKHFVATLLRKQGRFTEGLALEREILEFHEKQFGTADFRVGRSWTAVGLIHGYAGQYEPSERAFHRSLKLYRDALGEEHSSTVGARSNLAWLAGLRGDFTAAEAGHRRVLEQRERGLGPSHRKVGWTLYHLALAIANQGRDDEAEPLLQRALAIQDEVFGGVHEELAATLQTLGEIAERDDRSEEAKRFYERASDIYRQVLPAGHPDRVRSTEALEKLKTSAS